MNHPKTKRPPVANVKHLVEQELLQAVAEYDPKLAFRCEPIVVDDQALKRRCRYTYGLVWNAVRSTDISRLVPYDRSWAFVEILHVPTVWSRYDTELLLFESRHKRFLNGLALRDEFVRVLLLVLRRDFEQSANDLYQFERLDFTRNTIQVMFHSRHGEKTLIVSFIILVEFDVPYTTFFPDAYASLCQHELFNDYFQNSPNAKRVHLTASNSIKFQFDHSLAEAHLCAHLTTQTTPLSTLLSTFLKLRKQWLKHIPRALESVKRQAPTSELPSAPDSSLSAEVEDAFESLLSVPLLRLLFFTACIQPDTFVRPHGTSTGRVIADVLQHLADAVGRGYFEHPFSQRTNALPAFNSLCDMRVQLGITRLINELQRDCKRGRRR